MFRCGAHACSPYGLVRHGGTASRKCNDDATKRAAFTESMQFERRPSCAEKKRVAGSSVILAQPALHTLAFTGVVGDRRPDLVAFTCLLNSSPMLAVAILALSAVRPAVPASVLTLRGGVSNAPKVQYHAMAAGGAAKTKEPVPANLLSGALSGAYVSFAAVLSITVASALGDVSPGVSKLVFGGLFPIALLHILAGGNQLFTGNTAACAMAYYEGLIDMDALIRNWVVTYAGNLAGSIAFLEAFKMTGLLTGSTAKMAAGITAGKIKATFMQQVVKGIFANWLVCLGVFMATGESDLVGKMVGAWFPVSAFVMIGFEHSIANLFLLPLGLAAGADATVMDTITKNIIPVTIGNIIAGAVVFGGSYSYLYGALGGHTKD